MFGQKPLVKAVVQKIEPGKHGEYAVCLADGIEGSVTFDLDPSVWKGDWKPERGETVILEGLKRKRAGWRATKVRPFGLLDEQAKHSKEQIAYSIALILERWKSLLGDSKTEIDWRRWVSYGRREWRDLKALLENVEIADAHKARALFIILTPKVEWIPFSWNGYPVSKGVLGFREEGLYQGLSLDLVRFAACLLEEFYLWAKAHFNPEDYYSRQMVEGYNYEVVELLSCLPSQGEEPRHLFELFELNDAVSWADMESSSGYRPFSRLMRHKGVPETWKQAADKRMRAIVLSEMSGKRRPRESWESALKCYSSVVESELWDEGPQYRELFVDQVRFLLEVATAYRLKEELFEPWNFRRIFDLLNAEDTALALTFARFMVFDNNERGFLAYTQQDRETLEHVRQSVSSQDPQLDRKLERLISSAAQRIKENQARATGEQDKEQAILAALKKG